MRSVIAGIFLWFLAGFSQNAFPWGGYGHRVAATLAEAYCSERTREEIRRLIGEDHSLADVSMWADEIRSNKRTFSKWHKIYIPRDSNQYIPERDCPRSGCLVSAIQDFQKVLSDEEAPGDEREEALKFLVHLIADLHQPLHCGFREDQGGTAIPVRFLGRKSNLHKVWDSDLLAREKMTFNEYVQTLLQRSSKSQYREWMKGTILDWVFESRSLLRDSVYQFGRDKKLGRSYYTQNLPVVDRQLLKAGLRTAGILNHLLSGSQSTEAESSGSLP